MTSIDILPDPVDTLIRIHEVVDSYVQAASVQGSIPRIGTAEWLDATPVQQVTALLVAGEGYVVAAPEQRIATAIREASDDIHGGRTREWGRWADNYQSYAETQAYRDALYSPRGEYKGGPVRWDDNAPAPEP